MAGDGKQNLVVMHADRAAKVPLLRKMLVLRSLARIILIASLVYNQKTGPIGTAEMNGGEYIRADIFIGKGVVRKYKAPTTRICCRGFLANRITNSSEDDLCPA